MKLYKYTGIIALKIMAACLPFSLFAQGIQITPGLHLVVSGAPSLVFNNASLVNNGDFLADSSTVLFTGDGTTAGSFIGGNRPISFFNLSVNNPGNDIELRNNIAVYGRIAMSGGNLQLNNNILDLGNSGSISGETSNSCITGSNGGIIKITAMLNAPQAVNPGNIGVEITSDANLGLTVITRGHELGASFNGISGIQRYFDFVPETNMDLHATLRFFYLDGELAGNNKNKLAVFSSTGGTGNWAFQGRDNTDQVANWVMKSSIDQLDRFTLAIPGEDKVIKQGTTATLQIYPNPSHNAFTVSLFSDKETKDVINLYDRSGRWLERREVYYQAGLNNIQWDLGKYAAGAYFLEFASKVSGNIKMIKE
jgi:hypothetical protein